MPSGMVPMWLPPASPPSGPFFRSFSLRSATTRLKRAKNCSRCATFSRRIFLRRRLLGLVNYVVEDAKLQEAVMAYCSKLADRSPRGISLMKQLVRNGMETSLEEGLQLEFKTTVSYMQGEEADEGLAAFIEKRKPVFK